MNYEETKAVLTNPQGDIDLKELAYFLYTLTQRIERIERELTIK